MLSLLLTVSSTTIQILTNVKQPFSVLPTFNHSQVLASILRCFFCKPTRLHSLPSGWFGFYCLYVDVLMMFLVFGILNAS